MEKCKGENGWINLTGRKRIQELLEKGFDTLYISQMTGISRSNIYLEIRRGSINGKYDANESQKLSIERMINSRKKLGELTRIRNIDKPRIRKGRLNKIEEEIESIKTIIQTLSTLIEELYDTINNKLRNI